MKKKIWKVYFNVPVTQLPNTETILSNDVGYSPNLQCIHLVQVQLHMRRLNFIIRKSTVSLDEAESISISLSILLAERLYDPAYPSNLGWP